MKDNVHSEKKDFIFEISSDYKLNTKAVYDTTFSSCYCKLILETFT